MEAPPPNSFAALFTVSGTMKTKYQVTLSEEPFCTCASEAYLQVSEFFAIFAVSLILISGVSHERMAQQKLIRKIYYRMKIKTKKTKRIWYTFEFHFVICTDFSSQTQRTVHCKHIYFVLAKVYLLDPLKNTTFYQWKYLPSEIKDLDEGIDWKLDVGMVLMFVLFLF